MVPHQKNSFYPLWVASISMLTHLGAVTINFIDVHHYVYEEPGIMRDQSNIPGFSLGFYNDNHAEKLSGIGYRGEFGFDYTRYVGSGTSSDLYLKQLAEARTSLLQIQYNNNYNHQYDAKVYSGLGYRGVIDLPLQKRTDMGYLTYLRRSQYVYIPFGLTFKGLSQEVWSVQYNHFMIGSQLSFFKGLPGYSKNAKNIQDRGYGWEFSYTHPDQKESWYVRYWNIEDSKTDEVIVHGIPTLFIEPKNFSLELGWRYHF